MPLPSKKSVSYEEFLSIQESYEGKVEYNNGEIMKMKTLNILCTRIHSKYMTNMLALFFKGLLSVWKIYLINKVMTIQKL